MLPLHQSSIAPITIKKQDLLFITALLLKYGGGEETRTLTPCGAGT